MTLETFTHLTADEIGQETDVETLEQRIEALNERIGYLRGEERGEKYGSARSPERRVWSEAWAAVFDERRAVAERIAELTPIQMTDAIALAATNLAGQAATLADLARGHHAGNVELSREAIALDTIATVLRGADQAELLGLIYSTLREEKARLARATERLERIGS